MKPALHQVWTFRSESAPGTSYQTLRYTDGTTSCDCRGWCRRVAADGRRSCKHTRWVDLGIADRHCTATHTYHDPAPQPLPNPHAPTQIPTKVPTAPRLGQRKFAV